MKLTLDQINKIPDIQAREKLKRDIIEGYEFQKKEAAKQDFLTFVKSIIFFVWSYMLQVIEFFDTGIFTLNFGGVLFFPILIGVL